MGVSGGIVGQGDKDRIHLEIVPQGHPWMNYWTQVPAEVPYIMRVNNLTSDRVKEQERERVREGVGLQARSDKKI